MNNPIQGSLKPKMENGVELGIRRYRSLPERLSDLESNDSLMRDGDNISLSDGAERSNKIVCNSCSNYIRSWCSAIKKNNYVIWAREKMGDGFPYVLHYYTHVIFIIIFEIIFYFQYAVVMERKLIKDLIVDLVDNFADVYLKYYPDAPVTPEITEKMANEICEIYESSEQADNDKIYESCLMLIIILLFVFSIVILFGTRTYGFKLILNVLCDSLILLMILGIFEYFFFAFVILGYKIISAGDIICDAVQEAYKYVNTNN